MITKNYKFGVVNPKGVCVSSFVTEAEALDSAKRRLITDPAETGLYTVVKYITSLRSVRTIEQTG